VLNQFLVQTLQAQASGLSTPGSARLLTWPRLPTRPDPSSWLSSARLNLQLLAPALDYSGFPPHDDIPCYFTATAVALAIAFQALQAIQAPKLSKLYSSARLGSAPGSTWPKLLDRLDSARLPTPDYSELFLHDDLPRYPTAVAVALTIAFQDHQAIQAPELPKLPKLSKLSTLPKFLRL
jgi:hypothetical protein